MFLVAMKAINGHLYLTYSNYAPDESIMQEGINISTWKLRYEQKCNDSNYVAQSEYASYIYDAVWTYAIALDKLLANNHSLADDFHTNTTQQ